MNRRRLQILFLCLCLVFAGAAFPGPASAARVDVRPPLPQTPDRPLDRFYFCLERLMKYWGNDPAGWPDGRDKTIVMKYLAEVLRLDPGTVVFGKNLLGYGVEESREQARTDLKAGMTDAFGVPYDIILASNPVPNGAKFLSLFAGVGITQKYASFNRELAQKAYVVLKADLHSQFGVVFKNFNGRRIQFIAREINFLGCPGSGAPQFLNELGPPLDSARCLKAALYIGCEDTVPFIPTSFKGLKSWIRGKEEPIAVFTENSSRQYKNTMIDIIVLNSCPHDIEGYLFGMRFYGRTWLKPY